MSGLHASLIPVSVKSLVSVGGLSGIVSCDSDPDSNGAMRTAREASKAQALRNKGPGLSLTSPCF